MINLPLDQIREKIRAKTGLNDSEITAKIKDKLKALSGLISEEGAAHIVANELGVKLFEVGEVLQVKNILVGMRNVDFAAKVVQKYDVREFSTEKGAGKVASLLVGDETGVIRLVCWHKQADVTKSLNEGDTVKVAGGYVRENNGRKEVHLSELSRLTINPPGVNISVKPYTPQVFGRKKIGEIREDDQAVEVLATIVQVFDINFFEVCPQCNKRVRLKDENFACPSHGNVKPDFNYVLNVYLDDGSDNIRVVLWREQIEQLLGMTRQQVLSFRQDPALFEPMKTELLGNMIIVSGRASRNPTFDRIELTASRINKKPDPEEETKLVKEEAKEAKPKVPAKPKREEKKPRDDDEEFDLDKEMMNIDDL